MLKMAFHNPGIPKCLIVPPWIKAVFSRGTGCGWGWCYGIHLNGGRCVCPESGKEKITTIRSDQLATPGLPANAGQRQGQNGQW